MARRGLALVPENRALFHDLTTRENLRLARVRGRSNEDDVLDLLPELRKCLGRKAGLLSGGEQQMLAVGRALVARPSLLVVDEMSLGLAPVVVERLVPVLRTVAESFGTGVLVVEQHVAVALEVAERAYVLAQGRLVLEGRTADLQLAPRPAHGLLPRRSRGRRPPERRGGRRRRRQPPPTTAADDRRDHRSADRLTACPGPVGAR